MAEGSEKQVTRDYTPDAVWWRASRAHRARRKCFRGRARRTLGGRAAVPMRSY